MTTMTPKLFLTSSLEQIQSGLEQMAMTEHLKEVQFIRSELQKCLRPLDIVLDDVFPLSKFTSVGEAQNTHLHHLQLEETLLPFPTIPSPTISLLEERQWASDIVTKLQKLWNHLEGLKEQNASLEAIKAQEEKIEDYQHKLCNTLEFETTTLEQDRILLAHHLNTVMHVENPSNPEFVQLQEHIQLQIQQVFAHPLTMTPSPLPKPSEVQGNALYSFVSQWVNSIFPQITSAAIERYEQFVQPYSTSWSDGTTTVYLSPMQGATAFINILQEQLITTAQQSQGLYAQLKEYHLPDSTLSHVHSSLMNEEELQTSLQGYYTMIAEGIQQEHFLSSSLLLQSFRTHLLQVLPTHTLICFLHPNQPTS